MTYKLKKTASITPDYIVENHTINRETMISLIGKSYIGYGDELQQNTIDLLCNFHTQLRDYSKAIPGQLIYDGTNLKLCIADNVFINLLLLPCDFVDTTTSPGSGSNGSGNGSGGSTGSGGTNNYQPTGDVVIVGTLNIGSLLTATNTIDDEDGIQTDITYEWFLNGDLVSTGSTYIPNNEGILIVKATYTDNFNKIETVNSPNLTITKPTSSLNWTMFASFRESATTRGLINGIVIIDAIGCEFNMGYPFSTTDGIAKLLRMKNVVDSNGKPVTSPILSSTIISSNSTQLTISVSFTVTNDKFDYTSGSLILNSDAIA